MTNVWYVKSILSNCDGKMYLPILHLPRVELLCKLQEKLHRVARPSTKKNYLAKCFLVNRDNFYPYEQALEQKVCFVWHRFVSEHGNLRMQACIFFHRNLSSIV